MTLKDLLKKKEKIKADELEQKTPQIDTPEFTIIRSDTHSQEILSQPSVPAHDSVSSSQEKPSPGKRLARFRSASNASDTSKDSRGEKRLSSLLNLRSRSHELRRGSVNVPSDLPSIPDINNEFEDKEAQWEERATILARENPISKHRASSEGLSIANCDKSDWRLNNTRQGKAGYISDARGDDDIQEAIKLHESGDLENSTAMFGRLADPDGENNTLSQVLYGLALRHGWGLAPDASRAITYLSKAALNSASIESQALSSGLKKGGAAKGELVLAIYELANCFRHGWGVQKDPVAARSYYETAANLGDVDAMNEAARCYEEGFGGKKDKFLAAKYYRLAEDKGSKTLGNSWIWKDKYNPTLP